jgi:hypothetical protein
VVRLCGRANSTRRHRICFGLPYRDGRDTLENWQSKFLQLLWQVGGLAGSLYVGSPQSSEGDQRQEEKLDAILRAVVPKEADKLISEIDEKLARHG